MELIWDDTLGYGYFPVDWEDTPYDKAYFDRYASYEGSLIEEKLNAFRVKLTQNWFRGEVCDIGIGSGTYLKAMGDCDPMFEHERHAGFDVNPAGVEWLKKRGQFHDPYLVPVDTATFWDSLEHIPRPDKLLKNVSCAIISIPIFENKAHVYRSKHFRKDEHAWYFTDAGFKQYMLGLGFRCRHQCNTESAIGREGINTYVFVRSVG